MFSVMADKDRDGSTEKLAVCVHYVAKGSVKGASAGYDGTERIRCRVCNCCD